MRTRFGWLVALGLALAPAIALGQAVSNYNYEVPPSPNLFPGPFGHYRMEEGGFFIGLEGLYWHMPNPMHSQIVGVRGFFDADGTVINGAAGTFVGSGTPALDVRQISGGDTYTPGFNLLAGWRFESGVAIQIGWIHLVDVRHSAQASLIPPSFAVGPRVEDTFLFAPVSNFPIDYSGPAREVTPGNPGALFGIWNGAALMQIQFLQRFEQVDFTARLPMWDAQDFRSYALVGPRGVWIWERFKWRTVDPDINGVALPEDVADYSNVVSNRLYGVHAGCGSEWFLGDTPVGGFSLSVDTEAGLFVDLAKGRAKYELEDRSTSAHRNRNFTTIAPMLSGKIDLWWWPVEAIQINFGYDALCYFNTMASRRPIDFNFGSINPDYNTWVNRLFYGFHLGIGITF